MMVDLSAFNERLDRLAALVERMAVHQAQPPVVHVNVNMADLLATKKRGDNGEGNMPLDDSDVPDPGGMPRPYTS